MSERRVPTISTDIWKLTRTPLGRAGFLSLWTILTWHLAKAPDIVVKVTEME